MNPQRIQHLLEHTRKQRLLVVGDVMLDEFVWGKVSRISPEAPVPIVEVQNQTSYPGGAANVARNLRPFCTGAHISGLIGLDAYGRQLQELLQEEGIATAGLVESEGFPTIVKTRIIARHQQMVRVDREKKTPLSEELTEIACQRIEPLISGIDGVIFADYGKGFLTQALVDRVSAMATKAGKVIAADPNPSNPLRWNEAATVKPNRSEAFAMARKNDPGAEDHPLEDQALLEVGKILLDQFPKASLLITLGEHGMILFDRASAPYHAPTRAREVFDVSGAGDTVIALFTLGLCAGATPQEAAEIANHAAGVVVGKLGTATLSVDELLASLKNHAG